MRPADLPWGVTHEGKVEYFDPYDDFARDDVSAINFMTRYSSEAKAHTARTLMRRANKVIHDLTEADETNQLAELFIQLEEFRLD